MIAVNELSLISCIWLELGLSCLSCLPPNTLQSLLAYNQISVFALSNNVTTMELTSRPQASTLTLRQPPMSKEPPPGIEVNFKHPGYSDRMNTLISLVGLDRDGERVGLHFGTASIICAIISGRQDGFFTKGVNDPPLDLSEDSLLEQATYYYHIPNDLQYAVYPSFEHWPFPHNDLLPL